MADWGPDVDHAKNFSWKNVKIEEYNWSTYENTISESAVVDEGGSTSVKQNNHVKCDFFFFLQLIYSHERINKD